MPKELSMALARIARSGLRRGGGRGGDAAIGSFARETNVLCEGASTHKFPLPSVENFTNMSYIASIRKVDHMNLWSRGIRTTPQNLSAQAAEIIAEDTDSEYESPRYPSLEATKPGEKPRVVVLGTGWAACRFLKGLDTKMYDVVCISPRNHMVFTPLLASTCVGTLEFRSVAEPVSRIQTALAKDPNSYFYLASCIGVDSDKHEVYCEAVGNPGLSHEPYRFKVAYDKLVVAAGSEPLTFGIKGVKEHAFFSPGSESCPRN